MKLCYLINQYPKVSHSFIRREILELENQGAEVLRVALRGWEQLVLDSDDQAEQARTRYVLKAGAMHVLSCILKQAVVNPSRFLRALGGLNSLRRGSDKPLFKHLICLAEACVTALWIRRDSVDHIHAHFGTNSAEVAMLTSLLTGIPFSFTVHGPEEFDHPEGLGLRQKIRQASAVVAISSYGRSQLYRWAAAEDWRKIIVVHCGLDLGFSGAFEPVSQSGRSALVCVGRLCEQKGQLLLLAALRQVLDRGHACHIVLAGDGEMRAEIEQHATRLAVQEHVTITGWIGSGRVKQEILAARALLLPSFAEGLPVVLMEALALGRPVITTFVAGIPELVEDGRSGWLVPAGDTERLADAMIRCLECSDETLAQMGSHGRARTIQRHDIRTSAAQLLHAFAADAAAK